MLPFERSEEKDLHYVESNLAIQTLLLLLLIFFHIVHHWTIYEQ